MKVFFLTNRKPDEEARGRYFGGEAQQALTFGTASVHIPKKHKIGLIEQPWWSRESPDEHFIIESVEHAQRHAFLEDMGKENSPILLFVHGYNNTFTYGLLNLAQIVWDMGLAAMVTPVLFSWPSAGGYKKYVADKDSVIGSLKAVTETIRLLCGDAKSQPINIVAHSMGNLLLLHGLSLLVGNSGVVIKELIMAAPDVEEDRFRTLVKEIRDMTSGMTLYASSNDWAMYVSRLVSGTRKAGDVFEQGPITADGLDSIDVSAVAELFGWNHNTYASQKLVLDEVNQLLLRGIRPPTIRSPAIRSVPEGSHPLYWKYVV